MGNHTGSLLVTITNVGSGIVQQNSEYTDLDGKMSNHLYSFFCLSPKKIQPFLRKAPSSLKLDSRFWAVYNARTNVSPDTHLAYSKKFAKHASWVVSIICISVFIYLAYLNFTEDL